MSELQPAAASPDGAAPCRICRSPLPAAARAACTSDRRAVASRELAVARYLAEFLECDIQARLTGAGSAFCAATVQSRRRWALERPTALLGGYDGVRMPAAFAGLADEIWCTQLLPGSGLIDGHYAALATAL